MPSEEPKSSRSVAGRNEKLSTPTSIFFRIPVLLFFLGGCDRAGRQVYLQRLSLSDHFDDDLSIGILLDQFQLCLRLRCKSRLDLLGVSLLAVLRRIQSLFFLLCG